MILQRLQTRGNIGSVLNWSHFAGNENFFYQMGGLKHILGLQPQTYIVLVMLMILNLPM